MSSSECAFAPPAASWSARSRTSRSPRAVSCSISVAASVYWSSCRARIDPLKVNKRIQLIFRLASISLRLIELNEGEVWSRVNLIREALPCANSLTAHRKPDNDWQMANNWSPWSRLYDESCRAVGRASHVLRSRLVPNDFPPSTSYHRVFVFSLR